MNKEKAQQFIDDLQNVFDKYDLILDAYIEYGTEQVTIDILDRNENEVFTNFEMDPIDYSFNGFYTLSDGVKEFLTSYRSTTKDD